MAAEEKKAFTGPRCAECGNPLAAERASYDTPRLRLYCEECQPIRKLKESWLPMSGSCAGIFIVPTRKVEPRK